MSDMISPMMTNIEQNSNAISNMSKNNNSNSDQSPTPRGNDLVKYFESEKTGKEEFTVIDVLFRVENNFLQGLYYDKDERTFYESSGLYGESHVQKLVV